MWECCFEIDKVLADPYSVLKTALHHLLVISHELLHDPGEWIAFARFSRTLKGRFIGDDFLMTVEQLTELSGWANRARQ